MSTDTQVALSRIARSHPGSLSKMARRGVAPFLQKLYPLVSNPATDDLIRWSETGDSFFVLDHERLAHDVLPRWFKHSNFASFVRQLNMYGFHKIPHLQQGVLKSETENEIWNFEHQHFLRGQPDLLCLISRKTQPNDKQTEDGLGQSADTNGVAGDKPAGLSANSMIDINSIINGITAIRRHQSTISSDLNELKTSNQHLWQEALEARERYKKQQDMINRILKFLAGVFGHANAPHKVSPESSSPQGIPRRRQRLMIKDTQPLEKEPSVEPLDDDDFASEASTEDTGRIVEVPTPRTETTPTPMDKPEEKPDSNVPAIPASATDPANFVMNSGLNGQNTFIPFSHPMTQPNPAFYNSGYPHTDSSGALTSVNQGVNQDLLQAILNSPGQLQRLMQLLNLQQPNLPVPPPLDLNATVPQVDGAADVTGQNTSVQAQQLPAAAPLAIPNGFNFSAVDPGALSLLQPEEMAPMSFEPLVSNEHQLDKTYKDATEITKDIDNMQTSINSLMNNLGFDPSQLGHIPDLDPQAPGELPYTNISSDHFARPPLSTMHSTISDGTQPPLTDSTVDTDNGIPEFDFNAFINELERQKESDDAAGINLHELNPDALDTLVAPVNGVSTSPHLSPYIDEINSISTHSEASSPSASRDMEEPINKTSMLGSAPDVIVAKKARKRKSDADGAVTAERTQTRTKRKK